MSLSHFGKCIKDFGAGHGGIGFRHLATTPEKFAEVADLIILAHKKEK